jgi:transglutaminase-like putative cysteine protease
MPIFKIYHVTKYNYNRPVKESMNEIKVFPYQCPEQEILQHELLITNNPDVQVFNDYWLNKTGVFNVLALHKELVVESKLIVRTTASSQLKINFHSGFAELEQEIAGNLKMLEVATKDNIESQPEVDDILGSFYQPDKSVAAVIESCSEYIFKHFKYLKGITDIETTVDEILVHRSGVCQDFAHLMLQVLRSINIPSRYVSGYICPNKNGMRGEGATHAWVEAWIPGYGWAGIDPTNNVWVTNTHVKLAVGRHFKDCTPVKGSFRGPAQQTLSVYVSVGYEDGHMFEELNNVQLREHEANARALEEEFAAQQ